MSRKKLEKQRKRIGVYIEEELLMRFKEHYDQYGDFTQLVNDILKAHLDKVEKYGKASSIIR